MFDTSGSLVENVPTAVPLGRFSAIVDPVREMPLGSLVHVGHVDGELIVERQTASIGHADGDAVGIQHFEIEVPVGTKRCSIGGDVEQSIAAKSRRKDEGGCIPWIGIGEAQSAHDGIGASVLCYRTIGQADVNWCGVIGNHVEDDVVTSVD